MPIKVVNMYTRKDIQDNPSWLFVFGDNYKRQGTGGQAAEARGEGNVAGIRTKKAPTYNAADFMTDKEYYKNCKDILDDFKPVIQQLEVDGIVVWPFHGVGTGLAALPKNAPCTLQFINNMITSLKSIYGVEI